MTTNESSRPFTISETVTIEVIMKAVTRKCVVLRYLNATQSIVRGTARHLVNGPDDFNFFDPRADVRDAYLRVTLDTGFDVAWLVSDLMHDIGSGDFAIESGS